MLSEILDAYAPHYEKSREPHAPGISMSGLFPCPYWLWLVHTEQAYQREWTSQQIWNLDDGHDQEDQSVRRLEAAGVHIQNRQRTVYIGKSKVPGHYDGDFTLFGRNWLWEHKAYDSQSDAVQFLRMWGMDKLPSQRAQTNAYMLGGGLEWCNFFVKVKNNNTYIDEPYSIDRPFIDEIVEWCDRIRLDNWTPEKKPCEWCSMCRASCFGDIIDSTWVQTASETDAVDKWIQGKQFVNIGSMMQEEADVVLIGIRAKDGHFIQKGLIGDKDVLLLPGMVIKKTVSHRLNMDKSLILQHFGPEGLIKVGRNSISVSYRHKVESTSNALLDEEDEE